MKKSTNAKRFEENARKRQEPQDGDWWVNCIDPSFTPSDNRIRWVSDARKPPEPGFVRAWFNDGIGTSTGFRDIPIDLVPAAKSYQYAEQVDGWVLVQEFEFGDLKA